MTGYIVVFAAGVIVGIFHVKVVDGLKKLWGMIFKKPDPTPTGGVK